MRHTVTSSPVVSYTAVSPLPSLSVHTFLYEGRKAVYFLLRYLSGYPGRTLSAIVLYGARKFLSYPFLMSRESVAAATQRSHKL